MWAERGRGDPSPPTPRSLSAQWTHVARPGDTGGWGSVRLTALGAQAGALLAVSPGAHRAATALVRPAPGAAPQLCKLSPVLR